MLILWYWSSFEPLNRYGHETEGRLGKIEALLTILGMQALPGRNVTESDFGLRHFAGFSARHRAMHASGSYVAGLPA